MGAQPGGLDWSQGYDEWDTCTRLSFPMKITDERIAANCREAKREMDRELTQRRSSGQHRGDGDNNDIDNSDDNDDS